MPSSQAGRRGFESRLPLQEINRLQLPLQCRLCLGLAHLGLSPQHLLPTVPFFPPQRYPRDASFQQTTSLIPFTHGLSSHAPKPASTECAPRILASDWPCSLAPFHCSRLLRRTSFRRPIVIAGRAVTPSTLPLIMLYTCAFEQRRSAATSEAVKISSRATIRSNFLALWVGRDSPFYKD